MNLIPLLSGFSLLAVGGQGAGKTGTNPSRPNVLVIFCDDQRADTIASMGNPLIKTPNLDRLVNSGVAFKRAYYQGAFEGATCVPSRAMLLRGQSLFTVSKPGSYESWPAAFGKAGYSTFMTGKWHGTMQIPASFQEGRAIFVGGMTNPLKAPLQNVADGKLTEKQIGPKHACEIFADETINFLKAKRDKPFFCYLAFDAPHDPHIVPTEYPIKYEPNESLLPPNYLPAHPFDNGEMRVRDELLLPSPRPKLAVQQFKADYYRYVSYIDGQIGRILNTLDETGLNKSTIVVFAADSGVALGSHGLIGKQNVYEHSMRVPLVVRGPGLSAGVKTDAMCYLYDLLPTIGELCNVPAPQGSEGTSFSKVLKSSQNVARKEMFFAYRDVQRAYYDGRWKLIWYPKVNVTQLFDIQTDPFEMRDVASDPAQRSRREELFKKMKSQQVFYGDRCELGEIH